jgi:hypothetical protein
MANPLRYNSASLVSVEEAEPHDACASRPDSRSELVFAPAQARAASVGREMIGPPGSDRVCGGSEVVELNPVSVRDIFHRLVSDCGTRL